VRLAAPCSYQVSLHVPVIPPAGGAAVGYSDSLQKNHQITALFKSYDY
jgi:hypothetical protein